MTDYNNSKWHAWGGGECPVPPETRVHVTYTNGVVNFDVAAKNANWRRPLLFYIVKEYREPREFWLVGDYRFLSEEDAKKWQSCIPSGREIIHVREVLE